MMTWGTHSIKLGTFKEISKMDNKTYLTGLLIKIRPFPQIKWPVVSR